MTAIARFWLIVAAMVAPAAACAATARVTFLAGAAIYVDAGRAEGLAVGDTLDVARDGAIIASMRVTFLSTHRAACDTFLVAVMPRVGDVARYARRATAAGTPGAAPTDTALAELSTAAPPPSRAGAASPLRGRIGARWLGTSSDAGDLSQPSLDLWLEGRDLGGSHLDLAADVRGRRTSRAIAGNPPVIDGAARAYRLSLAAHDAASQRRITLGRQSSPLVSSVTIFDGALAEIGDRRWNATVFGGTEPDPVKLSPRAEVITSGAFVQWREAALAARRWTIATGGVVSTSHGQINRHFAFAQGFYRDRVLSAAAAQEVDVNTGWKRAAGEPLLSPTSAFVTARADLPRGISLDAGFDDRRNVRLYRDRETPETEFDDRYRQGAWGGASADPWRVLRVGGELRVSSGGGARSNAWSASVELWRVLPRQARIRGRVSRSSNATSETRLLGASVGIEVTRFAHLELGGGTRTTTVLGTDVDEFARWQNLDLDLALMRRLYVSGSAERTTGDLGDVLQEYAGLSWRF